MLIACATSPKPAEVGNQPVLAEPKAAPAPAPGPAPAPPPAPGPAPAPAPAPPPPAPAKKTVYEALRDTNGDIAGLAGFSITRQPDPTRCGGIAIVTTRAKTVAKDDQALADVLALEFPTGLSFDDAHKTASLQKLNAFMQQLTMVGGASRTYYEQKMHDGDVVAKMAGAARMAQIFTRLASVLARAEIPLDIRSDEVARDAYCDRLVALAAPIQGMAEQAMTECAAKKKIVNGGWWDPVCTAP